MSNASDSDFDQQREAQSEFRQREVDYRGPYGSLAEELMEKAGERQAAFERQNRGGRIDLEESARREAEQRRQQRDTAIVAGIVFAAIIALLALTFPYWSPWVQ